MPNYNGVWSLSTQYQNRTGWPQAPTFGFFAGGSLASSQGQIQQLIFATSGTTTDFGDLTVNVDNTPAGLASKTRGIVGGGLASGNNISNVMQYITMATSGNTTDFGDRTVSSRSLGGLSNNVRGIMFGGDV